MGNCGLNEYIIGRCGVWWWGMVRWGGDCKWLL